MEKCHCIFTRNSHTCFSYFSEFSNLISNTDVIKPSYWLTVLLPMSEKNSVALEMTPQTAARLCVSWAALGEQAGRAGWDSTLVGLGGIQGEIRGEIPPHPGCDPGWDATPHSPRWNPTPWPEPLVLLHHVLQAASVLFLPGCSSA